MSENHLYREPDTRKHFIPNAAFTTEEGVLMEPFQMKPDGYMTILGYRVTSPYGQVEHVFLNPSGSTGEGRGTGNVFLYHADHRSASLFDNPLVHVDFFQGGSE